LEKPPGQEDSEILMQGMPFVKIPKGHFPAFLAPKKSQKHLFLEVRANN
jgi:hypothetical protein